MLIQLKQVVFFSCVLFWAVIVPAAQAQAQAQAQARYSRVVEFGPVKATHADLGRVISKLRQAVKVEPNAEFKGVRERLLLSDGDVTVTLENGFSIEEIGRVAPVLYRASYSYSQYDGNGDVTDVNIELMDYTRTIEVAGRNVEMVRAASLLLSEVMQAQETSLSGPLFRNVLGAVLWVVASVFGVFGSKVLSLVGWKGWIPTLVLIATMGVVYLPPWHQFLPGFVLYAESASLGMRYSAEISVVGLVLTVVFGVVSIYLGVKALPPATSAASADVKGKKRRG